MKLSTSHTANPFLKNLPKAWQNVIWREWWYSRDETYAHHLFEVVIREPADQWAVGLLIFAGLVYGGLGSWLTLWLWFGNSLNDDLLLISSGLGAVGGGLGFSLLILLLRWSGHFTWNDWLQLNSPVQSLRFGPAWVNWDSLTLRWLFGLGSGVGVGLTGVIFFHKGEATIFYGWLVGLIIGALFGLFLAQRRGVSCWVMGLCASPLLCCQCYYALALLENHPDGFFFLAVIGGVILGLVLGLMLDFRTLVINGSVGLTTGVLFGFLFSHSFIQIVGMGDVSLDFSTTGRVVGLGVGLGAGLYLGRRAGLVIGLIWQISLIGFGAILLSQHDSVLMGWAFGLWWGGLLGSLSRLWLLSKPALTSARLLPYRWSYRWWHAAVPVSSEVEAVLRTYANGQNWSALFEQLDDSYAQAETIEPLISALASPNWQDRFVARQTLIALGDQAIRPLLNPKALALQSETWKLVGQIEWETRTRLAPQATRMICPECLTCCYRFRVHSRTFPPAFYYGCRTCGQSREFFDCSHGEKIIAVLDETMTSMTASQKDTIRINWLLRRTLFDFDQVEIIQASDEAVERFAVQVSNDTDLIRRPKYAFMSCRILPQATLSDSTLRILQRIFGRVIVLARL